MIKVHEENLEHITLGEEEEAWKAIWHMTLNAQHCKNKKICRSVHKMLMIIYKTMQIQTINWENIYST